MARSTHGWEDFKPRETEDGAPKGRQLFSYDGAIRLDCRRRTHGDWADWLFVNIRQRNGTWTRLCLDTDCTVVAQGFGRTRKEASKQLFESLRARGIGAFRALDADPAEFE
jgi:hypothetical protein